MIKAVVFDCFGVIYGASCNILTAMAPIASVQGVKDAHNAKDYGYISYDEFLDEVADLIGISTDEVRDIIYKKQILNQELIEYIKELKSEYKIGLLSNVDEMTIERLFGDSTVDLFDEMVLSSSVGLIKPQPEIYQLMCDKLGLKPEECIMIDDLKTNCEGAKSVGMLAICHESNQATKQQINEMLESR